MQVKLALDGITAQQIRRVVIAYEPIWAIGTGVAATAQEAQETCAVIRDCLRELYGARTARAISILYGGSMKPSNAGELLAQPDIDGGLIGGAALDAESFAALVKLAENA
jgi:triosephosphate isomerase